MQFLDVIILHNSVLNWLVALGATLVAALLLVAIKRLAGRRLRKSTSEQENRMAYVVEILAHTRPSFLAIICLYTGSRFIELTDRPDHIFNNIVVIALFIQRGLRATVAPNGAIARYR